MRGRKRKKHAQRIGQGWNSEKKRYTQKQPERAQHLCNNPIKIPLIKKNQSHKLELLVLPHPEPYQHTKSQISNKNAFQGNIL